MGLSEHHEVQQSQVQGPALGLPGQSQAQTDWVESAQNTLRAALRRGTCGCWLIRSSSYVLVAQTAKHVLGCIKRSAASRLREMVPHLYSAVLSAAAISEAPA